MALDNPPTEGTELAELGGLSECERAFSQLSQKGTKYVKRHCHAACMCRY